MGHHRLGRDDGRGRGRDIGSPLCRVEGEQLCEGGHVRERRRNRKLLLGGGSRARLNEEGVGTKVGEEGIEVKGKRRRVEIWLHGSGGVLMGIMGGGFIVMGVWGLSSSLMDEVIIGGVKGEVGPEVEVGGEVGEGGGESVEVCLGRVVGSADDVEASEMVQGSHGLEGRNTARTS